MLFQHHRLIVRQVTYAIIGVLLKAFQRLVALSLRALQAVWTDIWMHRGWAIVLLYLICIVTHLMHELLLVLISF